MSIYGNISIMYDLKVINEYLMGLLSDYLEILYTYLKLHKNSC